MSLKIFNVLGREKQAFKPIEPGRINMYVCGPTVYDHAHLGHARSYVSFDLVVRWLRHSGYDVLYVQNITDVGHLTDDADQGDDKILKRARQIQAKPMQLVETYTRSFFADMDALGVLRPDISPRASGHIPEQIKMVETLIEKDHAYECDGSVYFDVTTDPDYGKLSNRKPEQQAGGTREAVRSEKRNPQDFALWKKAEPEHILRWDSPWGEGFPGWHIECSAMAKKYLGETFDIHGGGLDNIFPHNECEIAQSECANDAPFANYWMLVGTLNVADAEGVPVKMGKSLGNFVTLRQAFSEYRPEVIRMFVFSAHYSNPVTYSPDALGAAQSGWERLNNAARLVRQMQRDAPADGENTFSAQIETARTAFTEAMDDDFNAPKAIAALQEFTREVNARLNSDAPVNRPTLDAIAAVYKELGGDVLGVVVTEDTADTGDRDREARLIEILIEMRKQARQNKDFAASDRIRDELAAAGVMLEDRPDGTVWKLR